MPQAFDTIARDYDVSFTNTLIGTAQRKIVWDYLEKSLTQKKRMKVLELNCGTGEDAVWFTKQGHTILATDISEEMLAITQKKINDAGMQSQVQILKLDITQIQHIDINEKFDLIFSNFGGMNCISPMILNRVPSQLSNLLNRDGRLIMVIMPTFCLWETIYFLIKVKLRNAFRRLSKSGIIANLNGSEFKIYYYSPDNIKRMFGNIFSTITIMPVGFFLPPSYLEKFFIKNRKLFIWLSKLENLVSNRKLLAGFSDHYLIDFKLN